VPRRAGPGPRIAILGLLEARLLDVPLVVLGGLNEGVWPPETETDPFLNRPMRAEIGLPAPERRIGQSAHDFVQALHAPRVVLSRAARLALKETVPSRFWQRLQAVSPAADWAAALERGAAYCRWAKALDQPEAETRPDQPEPRPPAELQPVRFSVTEIETLHRDPYAIFARKILRLDEIEPLAAPPGASDRGEVLHAIVAEFGAKWPKTLPADSETELVGIARRHFAPLMGEPDVAAFWWPRFLAIAQLFIAWETARRPLLAQLQFEVQARLPAKLADGAEIALTARADRVERSRAGQLRLVDFKSGRYASKKEIKAGFAPQLPLEAAMARRVAFGELPPGSVESAAYVVLKPGGDALTEIRLEESKDDLAAMAEEQLARLREVLLKYRRGQWGFRSRLKPRSERDIGVYDHLARVKEWSRLAGFDEGGEE
jgi:ATP-dependent helicase/nuclease subunit B